MRFFKAISILAACAITSTATPLTASAASANVKKAQEILAKLGYDVGEPDGAWGSKSRAALNAFQEKEGFPKSRKLGKSALSLLELVDSGAKQTEPRTLDKVIGKTLVLDSGIRVYYSPNGKKTLRLKNGRQITKKWRKRKDGTYCEYWFSKKKTLCNVDRKAIFISYKQNDDTNVYFDRKTGARKWAIKLVEGNKLKP